jgi:peptidyl-prolyl cis-trans isomerase SurA
MIGGLPVAGSAGYRELDSIAAVVQDKVIMKSDLEARIAQIQESMRRAGQEPPKADKLTLRVLDEMINESLITQMAGRIGLEVSDEDIDQSLAMIAQRNGMTPDQFVEVLADDGRSLEDLRKTVAQQLLLKRTREEGVRSRIRISDADVQAFLASEEGRQSLQDRYHLRHIFLPLPPDLTDEQKPMFRRQANQIQMRAKAGESFAQLAQRFSSSSSASRGGDIGWQTEKQLPELFVNTISAMAPGDISDLLVTESGFHIIKLEDRQGFDNVTQEQTRVRHILIQTNQIRDEEAAQALIAQIHRQIKNGEPFEQLAQALSDDGGSKTQGGDLDWVDPARLTPAFRKVMGETGVNEVSAPFKSEYGWHILEVTGRRTQDVTQKLTERAARERIFAKRFEEELENWSSEMRDQAFIDIRL